MDKSESPRYCLISTDAHAGADIQGYGQYLPKAFHDEFDAWAATFDDPWSKLDDEMHDRDDPDIVMGRASFVSRYSWESETRLEHMDAEGIAAEVVFPNTVPPFYPAASSRLLLLATRTNFATAGRASRRTTDGWPTSPRRRRAGALDWRRSS